MCVFIKIVFLSAKISPMPPESFKKRSTFFFRISISFGKPYDLSRVIFYLEPPLRSAKETIILIARATEYGLCLYHVQASLENFITSLIQ